MNYRLSLVLALYALTSCIQMSEARHRNNLRATNMLRIAKTEPQVDATPAAETKRPTPETYNFMRDAFFRFEESKAFGSELELNERELAANQVIMAAKTKEYDEGLAVPHLFSPSQHFFSVMEEIKSSAVFQYLSIMPKGAILHSHDTALCSTKFIVGLTKRDNLWGCENQGSLEIVSLLFSKSKPEISIEGADCTWELMSKIREKHGADKVDEYIGEHLTMYPTEKYLDVNAAWDAFSEIFGLLSGLLTYAPVWADYYYNALEEFAADGVQYLEFRSTLPTLYDLDGTVYTEMDTVRIYKETLDKFMSANLDFIGSKMIYAPIRNVDDETVYKYVKICIEIKEKYPDFVAGFDLVGQEELGRPLKDFIPQILSLPDHIDFFFHAGETNWYGSTVDENLIDAVLLGTKRIGHGFGVLKHPVVLKMIKERNIAIEVNPISNQVLQLISDLRNHPCSHLFADNYPIVISSDDPSFFGVSPLSHDFYIAFLGLASAHADLRFLKKLALNSIEYSSMSTEQKKMAMDKWQVKWDDFIARVVDGEIPITNSSNRYGLQSNRID